MKVPGRVMVSRRSFLAAGGLAAASTIVTRPVRALGIFPEDFFEGQRPVLLVYFPETGHHLSGDFLREWGRRGGLAALGLPISEPVVISDVEYQAFRNGILSRRLDGQAGDSSAGEVLPLKLGWEWANKNPASLQRQNGDRTSAYRFWWTGYGVHPRFWRAFLDGGGAFVFGYPLSNLVIEEGVPVQWFNRARFEIQTSQGEQTVELTPLGEMAAQKLGMDLSPASMDPGARTFDGVTLPIPDGPREERKIEIDLTQQKLYAYQGGNIVHKMKVSTGRRPTPTPAGVYPIIRLVENERMIGGTPGTNDYYDLSNVYFTQYFTNRGHALHYAYWHDNFGQIMSHGCVNLTLWDSKWLWDFAGRGVPIVTYHSR